MEPLFKLYHEIVQIILQGLDPKAFNLFAGQLSICLTEAVWPRKSSGTLQSWWRLCFLTWTTTPYFASHRQNSSHCYHTHTHTHPLSSLTIPHTLPHRQDHPQPQYHQHLSMLSKSPSLLLLHTLPHRCHYNPNFHHWYRHCCSRWQM